MLVFNSTVGLIGREKGVGLKKRYYINSGKDLLYLIVVHAIQRYKIAVTCQYVSFT